MILDLDQATDAQGRRYGFVLGVEGGFRFTWLDTLEATLASVEADEDDGPGGLDREEVVAFLRGELREFFRPPL